MDAIRVPVTPKASNHGTHELRRRPAWLLAAMILLPVGIQAAQQPMAAVWKERKLSFSYSSETTIYSCRSMAGRVSSILRAVGARDDIQVRVSGCSDSMMATQDPRMDTRVTTNPWQSASDRYREPVTTADRRQVAQVYVRMMLPTEVTPEVLAELEKDKTRRELVSRVTGNPAAKFNDPVLFQAERQLVTLSRETIGIEPEECELLDEMSVGVFRELGVRVVSTDFVCSAGSLIPPEAVVEALLPTPYATGTVQPAPGPAEDDDDAGAAPAAEDDAAKPAEEETSE